MTHPDHDDLPVRPRRRLATPVTLGLGAVIVAAAGFAGGVQVQKHERSGSGGGALTAARAGAGGLQAPRQGQGRSGAAPVTGQVDSVDGRTLYVKGADGTTVKVRTTGASKVTRTAKSAVRRVHPGDTVVITGRTGAGGTVTAGQITATASNAGATGGLGGFFGGGGPAPAG